MIQIANLRNTISITGHAEFDVEGKDIVCAGVSASAQLLADILQAISGATVEKRKGNMYINYSRGIHPDIVVAKFMKQMRLMAEQYPKNIQVVEVILNANNSAN